MSLLRPNFAYERFREIKYQGNILAVHCNNVTNAKSGKLNSYEKWGKPQNIIPAKHKAFTVAQIYMCVGLNHVLMGCWLLGTLADFDNCDFY